MWRGKFCAIFSQNHPVTLLPMVSQWKLFSLVRAESKLHETAKLSLFLFLTSFRQLRKIT
jgi:hypothetical protein